MKPSKTRLTRSARHRLTALLDGTVVGQVFELGNGRLVFRYEESWRSSSSAYPLSLSMPLAAAEHGDRALRSWLWGLLPENPDVLGWWARRYEVSRYRVVDLLEHVGEDCAGAVQFAIPARVDALTAKLTVADEQLSVDWLTEGEIEQRLRELRLNPAASRSPGDRGQFSLAGAQPKTALYQSASGALGVPRGGIPTNRILKPTDAGLDDLAYNEHGCLMLARELGIPAAASRVETFGNEQCIVIERYDRAVLGETLRRIHQEDCCQALGVLPTRKYQTDGGPAVVDIAHLIARYATDPETDLQTFIDAIALNWLIAGTDAHAKNFSILHARGPQVRLAPLYDMISALPYPQLSQGNARLAMSIGGEYVVDTIGVAHWRKLAKALGMEASEMLHRIARLADEVPGAVGRVRERLGADEPAQRAVSALGARIAEHCRSCAARL